MDEGADQQWFEEDIAVLCLLSNPLALSGVEPLRVTNWELAKMQERGCEKADAQRLLEGEDPADVACALVYLMCLMGGVDGHYPSMGARQFSLGGFRRLRASILWDQVDRTFRATYRRHGWRRNWSDEPAEKAVAVLLTLLVSVPMSWFEVNVFL